jgi:transcriptional regulator with AAA-type ATPase domain
VVQPAFDESTLAMIAIATGASDGVERGQAAVRRISALGVSTQFLERRANAISAPIVASWREQTLTEKLVVAMDRLGVKGLDPSAFRRELQAVVAWLFPEREALVGGRELSNVETTLEIAVEGGAPLRFGVRGALEPEQQAALALIGSFARQRVAQAPVELEHAADNVLPEFIAAAPATRRLKGEIVRLSRSNATILIQGESGSGKEVVARAVHDVSLRSNKPYVTFNCASVPRDLFESQLFGHRRGAFTGAVSDSPGVIRAADGGTLFLDEIGELPLDTQPKLLRFLENSEVLALGEVAPRRVDVRIVAATHRDLGRLVSEGKFREDLYYRLNVVPLRVPPLRERKEDVIALARLFIGRLVEKGAPVPALGADAAAALQAHGWPGNVRELRNVVERAMAYSPIPSMLGADHLRLARS